MMRPTLSLLRMAENASTAASSAASSFFVCFTLPNCPDALTSTTNITVSSRSSSNFIAGQVLAHFLEFHPAALEHGMVLSAEHVRHLAVGANLDLANFFENLS